MQEAEWSKGGNRQNARPAPEVTQQVRVGLAQQDEVITAMWSIS